MLGGRCLPEASHEGCCDVWTQCYLAALPHGQTHNCSLLSSFLAQNACRVPEMLVHLLCALGGCQLGCLGVVLVGEGLAWWPTKQRHQDCTADVEFQNAADR